MRLTRLIYTLLLAPVIALPAFCLKAEETGGSAERDYLLAQGLVILKTGQNQDAIPAFEDLRKKFPEDPELTALLGELYLSKGDISKSLRLFAESASKWQGNAGLRKRYGVVALMAGNLPVAQRELSAALELKPQDAEALALLGTALWKLDEQTLAAEKFKAACEINKNYCELSLAAESSSLYKKAAYEQALETLETKDFDAAEFDGLFDDIRRAAYERLSLDKPLSAFIRTGAGYDSNAIYDPEISGKALAEQKSSPFFSFSGGLGATPLLLGFHSLGGDLSASRNFYLNDSADDFDATSLRLSPRYRYSYKLFGIKQNILFRYVFNMMMFDGGPLVEEDSAYVFNESHSARLRLVLKYSESEETRIDAGGGWEGYRDIKRTGEGLDFSISEGSFYLDNRLKFFPGFLFSYFDAYHSAYDSISPGGFLGVSYLAPYEIDAVLRLYFVYTDHFRSGDYENWGKERKDYSATAQLSVSKRFFSFLRPELSAMFDKNYSNVEQFDYSKVVILFSIGAEY